MMTLLFQLSDVDGAPKTGLAFAAAMALAAGVTSALRSRGPANGF